jgi:WD40 repeat protein
MWIRCPQCDVAFQVTEDRPQADVSCPACGARLGVVGDATVRVAQPLPVRPVATLTGHTGGVWSVAFSPDGRWLASGSLDGTARLWDPATGDARATIAGHQGGVLAVAFTPDGRTLASGSQDYTLRLWDLGSQRERVSFPRYSGAALAFSPDSRWLVTGGRDDSLRIWDVEQERELSPLHVGRHSVRAVAFSPDGTTLALGHDLGSGVALQLWDLGARAPRWSLEGQNDVTSVCFSPEGSVLAAADRHGHVKLWDPIRGENLATLIPLGRNQYFRPSPVCSIACSPRGSWLAMGLYLQGGPSVQWWDMNTSQPRAMLEGHRNSVQSVAFSSDGATLASGSRDRTIRLWRLASSGGEGAGSIEKSWRSL